ncbi:hypothetical protein BDN72DRAFT_894862 [Pluteus cervinus]|uniref:Uncharacterized protein n=1 Tax=Pluteus cervinus TaxID=181527 RepID=A0ACD3B2Q9_9AGAR|nr:hypothetical protein BDN72DRAFT_894862 [Pluteus cervinus]
MAHRPNAAIKTKQPLHQACEACGLEYPKSANLERLRGILVNYWYPQSQPSSSAPRRVNLLLPSPPLPDPKHTAQAEDEDEDEHSLVETYGITGAFAEEVLGYDLEPDDEELEEDEDDDDDDEESAFEQFKTQVRVSATRRAEGNRRPGGLKTQKAMVRVWNEFVQQARQKRELADDIVDEHSLLLYINYSAERPKRTRQRVDIPGTFIGASQLKKQFFGALRIRKEQDAMDKTLVRRRPATTVVVWDAIKNRMNEALERVRKGLAPNEDAPDIVANTFLAEITDEQRIRVGDAFLEHRELRSTLYGHLAWTTQNASGNRGDDLRALQLAELQPWEMLHPDKETKIFAVLGLQGEEKAAKRGMRTTVNPVYTVFISHLKPEHCPLGALAFYHHYLYDVKDIATTLDIDWNVNKSWRTIRVLHGPKSPRVPYNEQNLYNLYVHAFVKAGFQSRIKAHLPRHMLGYLQESMGVDARDTAKLGWVRGETYFDTYAPALPKPAILAAHGYKVHEAYNPVWRHVNVPTQFLSMVCPMAESIVEMVNGRMNLVGTTNYWRMIILLRPYVFQCGAAIFQRQPKSALFRLPALAHPDVQNWMRTTFCEELLLLQAAAGSPVDLSRVQDKVVQQALSQIYTISLTQISELRQMHAQFERRTAILSPTKGYSAVTHHARLQQCSNMTTTMLQPLQAPEPAAYEAEDHTFRAYVSSSPRTPETCRSQTQVDLVLPPVAAFSETGSESLLLFPPILGCESVTWPNVFCLIRQPDLLWDCWKPNKSLDQYTLEGLWACYAVGEAVVDSQGEPTGMKPPLRLVEQHFQASWRKKPTERKVWQRFREIPEWIESEAASRNTSPQTIINELEEMRKKENGGMNRFMKHIKDLRCQQPVPIPVPLAAPAPAPSSPDAGIETEEPPSDGLSRKRRAKPVNPRTRSKRGRMSGAAV